MPARPDITENLVHFIRGETVGDALAILRTILTEGTLRGGTGWIRGGYRCVCFTEAPVEHLGDTVTRSSTTGEQLYQPVGIMVTKSWLFEQGGRPVIYQPDDEYAILPEEMRWRHVRYFPLGEYPVDFTWEREWRINVDELRIDPGCARVVVPSRALAEELMAEYEAEQDWEFQFNVLVGDMDENLAWMQREDFPWEVIVIDEL